jgi:hypothetical protein
MDIRSCYECVHSEPRGESDTEPPKETVCTKKTVYNEDDTVDWWIIVDDDSSACDDNGDLCEYFSDNWDDRGI